MLVQHVVENAAKLILICDGQQPAFAHACAAHAGEAFCEIGTVIDKPLQASLEVGQPIEHFRLQSFHCKQRDQSHHGADLHRKLCAVRQLQHVVEETVFFTPKSHTV